MPAAARSRLCSRVLAWAGAFARSAMSKQNTVSERAIYVSVLS